MPPTSSTRGGPSGPGPRGRGRVLKFQPKSSTRRSKEEREADEKREHDKIKAEEATAERERQRAERRSQRGGRGRGSARGGMSGWMSREVERVEGHLSGSSGFNLGRGGSGGGGSGGGNSGGGGGSGGVIGMVWNRPVEPESSGRGSRAKAVSAGQGAAWMPEELSTRIVKTKDGERPMRLIDIDQMETINLISDDEGEDAKGKEHVKFPRQGLAPIRLQREAHKPRHVEVNIDLDEVSPEEREQVQANVAKGAVPTKMIPIKMEDDGPPSENVKLENEEEPMNGAETSKTRKQTLRDTPAIPTTTDLDEKPLPPSQPPQQGRSLNEMSSVQMREIPQFITDPNHNFVPTPRPPGWESKEDTENWIRNQENRYNLYVELSFPEKMNRDDGGTPADKQPATEDSEMRDAKEQTKDRKEEKVYVFQIPPGIPGLEGLRTKNTSTEDDLKIVEGPSSPKASRSRSPDALRKGKAKIAGESEPKIKEESEVKIENLDEIPSEADRRAAAAARKKASANDEKPGYIGDLVIYNTGEAKLDWGGLPLILKGGLQSTMLQQVLLTSASVTKEAAIAAEDAKKGVKRESGTEQTGGGETEMQKAHSMGHVMASFTAMPDFKEYFGDKWKYVL